MNTPRRAYAYIRFSTIKQKEGDSLRRQLEACKSYCSENSIELDEREFKDFGKSAYKKANIKKGAALNAFLQLVESGEIAKGSYLLIESLDRLSRADLFDAFLLFNSIISRGIVIVEINNRVVYNKETLNQLAPILIMLSSAIRAHDESKIKGIRSTANWSRRKENSKNFATPITRECPRWLKVSDDGKSYELLPDKVASIRYVYELRKSGLGASAIANRCNENSLPVPGKGQMWHTSLINRLIKNRALIGEYQPHKTDEEHNRVPDGPPIKAFYPPAIDLGLFETVQQLNQKAGEFPKRRSLTNRNFLNGIFFCSCGAKLHRKLKSAAEKDSSRYYCSKRMLRASDCKSVDCRSVEDTVIYFMSENAPGLITFEDFGDKLRTEEATTRSRITEIESQIERLTNLVQFGKAEDTPATIFDRLQKLEKEKALLKKVAERFLLETKDSAVYWGIKADKDFVTAIRIKDSDKLSHFRFQISRLVEKIELSKDLKSLRFHLKNSVQSDIEIQRNYFEF